MVLWHEVYAYSANFSKQGVIIFVLFLISTIVWTIYDSTGNMSDKYENISNCLLKNAHLYVALILYFHNH